MKLTGNCLHLWQSISEKLVIIKNRNVKNNRLDRGKPGFEMNLKERYEKLLKYCYMKTKDGYLAEDRKLLRHKGIWWSMVKYAAVMLVKNMVCFR